MLFRFFGAVAVVFGLRSVGPDNITPAPVVVPPADVPPVVVPPAGASETPNAETLPVVPSGAAVAEAIIAGQTLNLYPVAALNALITPTSNVADFETRTVAISVPELKIAAGLFDNQQFDFPDIQTKLDPAFKEFALYFS